MRALILDGTTFVGLAVARELIARGHETAIFTRGRRLAGDPALPVTRYTGDRDRYSRPWDGQEPRAGDLAQDLLRVLCATLREYITSDACRFCVWDGYGWEHGSSASVTSFAAGTRPTAPPPEEKLRYNLAAALRVSLPYREYLLFEGPLDAAIGTATGLPAAVSSRSHQTCFGPKTVPGALRRRSTCTRPLLAGRKR